LWADITVDMRLGIMQAQDTTQDPGIMQAQDIMVMGAATTMAEGIAGIKNKQKV
jgi:hypothetical protein